jgi:cytochrome P450
MRANIQKMICWACCWRCATEDTGEGMTDQQARDEVVTIFFAGHETTAATMTWAFYLLSEHPEIEMRVRMNSRLFSMDVIPLC